MRRPGLGGGDRRKERVADVLPSHPLRGDGGGRFRACPRERTAPSVHACSSRPRVRSWFLAPLPVPPAVRPGRRALPGPRSAAHARGPRPARRGAAPGAARGGRACPRSSSSKRRCRPRPRGSRWTRPASGSSRWAPARGSSSPPPPWPRASRCRSPWRPGPAPSPSASRSSPGAMQVDVQVRVVGAEPSDRGRRRARPWRSTCSPRRPPASRSTGLGSGGARPGAHPGAGGVRALDGPALLRHRVREEQPGRCPTVAAGAGAAAGDPRGRLLLEWPAHLVSGAPEARAPAPRLHQPAPRGRLAPGGGAGRRGRPRADSARCQRWRRRPWEPMRRPRRPGPTPRGPPRAGLPRRPPVGGGWLRLRLPGGARRPALHAEDGGPARLGEGPGAGG